MEPGQTVEEAGRGCGGGRTWLWRMKDVAVEDAGRGCVTAGLAGYGESSFCPLLSSICPCTCPLLRPYM